MKFVLASKNSHKLEEMRAILAPLGVELVLQSELGVDVDVEETGATFEENSLLKARAVMEATGLPAIADDSGLSVPALGGEPGVYSARYGGDACKTDADRYQLLLQKLQGKVVMERAAEFVCVITAIWPDGRSLQARGSCEGVIALCPHGEGGFGYDPVFYVPQEGCTFAEMDPEKKNAISHRANALKQFVEKLREEGVVC